jgi:AraC-like DNA-binding protein
MAPIASLWSYESRGHAHDRRRVAVNADGSHEYWLERSDPLLNTILPGTGVSLIVNCGDLWAAGRSLATSEQLPRISVIGPVTQMRMLRVGRTVRAIGAGFLPTLTSAIFDVPASELVDRIVPLEELWTPPDVEQLLESVSPLGFSAALSVLRDTLVARIRRIDGDAATQSAPRLITLIKRRGGRVSVDGMARGEGLSRHLFARRFCSDAGLAPKLFARITRFQALLHGLLSTDVAQWASMSPAAGFYDQAHMINEFRSFTGSPPTVFFRPHGIIVDPATIQVRGRPSEWTKS